MSEQPRHQCEDCKDSYEDLRIDIADFPNMRSDKTIDAYAQCVTRYVHWLCHEQRLKIEDGWEHAKKYLDHYKCKDKGGKKREPKSATRNHNAAALKKYYKQVYSCKIEYKCNHIGEGEVLHDMVTFEEMEALVFSCKREEDKLILKVFYCTGMRTGEL